MPRIAGSNELLIANSNPAEVWGLIFDVPVADADYNVVARIGNLEREQVIWAMFQWFDADYGNNLRAFVTAVREDGEEIRPFVEENLTVAKCEAVYRLVEAKPNSHLTAGRREMLLNEVRTNLDYYYDLNTDWAVSVDAEPYLHAAVAAMETILKEDL